MIYLSKHPNGNVTPLFCREDNVDILEISVLDVGGKHP